MRPTEAPRNRVVRAGGLIGGVEIAKAKAHPAEPDLGGEAAGGARADAAVSPSFPAAWWRGGGKAKKSRERAVARHRAGRERWQGTERWEGVGFYKARRTPSAKTSARPADFSHARAILSRRPCYLYSLLYCYIYFIFNIYR